MSLYEAMGLANGHNGKRWASGTLTPGSADVEVETGLRTVEDCFVSMAAPPTANHLFSTGDEGVAPSNIRIRSYKPTSAADTTPVAATVLVAVTWIAIGT